MQLVQKLRQTPDFKDISYSVQKDIKQKWYSIFQVFSNKDLVELMDQKEILENGEISLIPENQVKQILKIQDKTTFVAMKDKIFFDWNRYQASEIEKFFENFKKYKNFLKNSWMETKNSWKIEKYTKYFSSFKTSEKFERNFWNIIWAFILLILTSSAYFVIAPWILALILYSFYYIYKIFSGNNFSTQTNRNIFYIFMFIGEISMISTYIQDYKNNPYNRIIRIRKNYNQHNKNDFLFQFKQIDDIIYQIQTLEIKKLDLYNNFSSLKNYQLVTSDISNLLLKLTKKLQNFESQSIDKKEILAFAKQNFDIVIQNWVNILEKIQNDIKILNSDAKNENQKILVQSTNNLNWNILVAIKQLETLKV